MSPSPWDLHRERLAGGGGGRESEGEKVPRETWVPVGEWGRGGASVSQSVQRVHLGRGEGRSGAWAEVGAHGGGGGAGGADMHAGCGRLG